MSRLLTLACLLLAVPVLGVLGSWVGLDAASRIGSGRLQVGAEAGAAARRARDRVPRREEPQQQATGTAHRTFGIFGRKGGGRTSDVRVRHEEDHWVIYSANGHFSVKTEDSTCAIAIENALSSQESLEEPVEENK